MGQRHGVVDRHGGGVAFYFRNYSSDFFFQVFGDWLGFDKLNFLIAEIRFESVFSLLLGIYRPPNIGYLNEFQNQLLIFKLIMGTLLFLGISMPLCSRI